MASSTKPPPETLTSVKQRGHERLLTALFLQRNEAQGQQQVGGALNFIEDDRSAQTTGVSCKAASN